MSEMIVLNGTLQFPSLYQADRFDKYSSTLLFPKGGTEHQKMQAAINRVTKDLGGSLPSAVCLKDGDEQSYDGYAGNMFVSASRAEPFQPHQLIDRQKRPVSEGGGTFYAGAEVNMAVNLWAQNNKWGKKINAELVAVQFVNDGDRLSTGKKADISDDTFAELPPLEGEEMTADDLI